MLQKLLREMRHRRVLRTAFGYAVFAFAAVEATDIITPVLGLSERALPIVLVAALAGFPVVMLLAWHYDLTGDGIVAGTAAPNTPSGRKSRTLSALLAILVAAAIAWLGLRLIGQTQASRSVTDDDRTVPTASVAERSFKYGQSVAVLPLRHIAASNDDDSAYFGDGIAEEILTALSNVDGLRVAARTSSFTLRDRQLDARGIGEALRVSVVLDGSVRRAGDQLRVSAQLVDTGSGFQLWSQVFDAGVDDVFAVQEQIARTIVRELQLELEHSNDNPMVRPGTNSTAAYELYLRGRHLLAARRLASSQAAVDAFEQAIDIDADFAQAHAGLADAWISLREIGNVPMFEANQRSHDAITHALRLDNQLPEAQTSLGLCILGGGNRTQAMQQFDRALQLDPDYVDAHLWRANVLRDRGNLSAATLTFSQALALDPANPAILENQALLFALEGRYAVAREQLQDVRASHPQRLATLLTLSSVERLAGNAAAALAAADDAIAAAPDDPVALAAQIDALAYSLTPERGRAALERALTLAPKNELVTLAAMQFYLVSGDRDALAQLAETRAAFVLDNPGFEGTDMYYRRLVWAGRSRLASQRTEDAVEVLGKALRDSVTLDPQPESVYALALLTRALHDSGNTDDALATAERARAVAARARDQGHATAPVDAALAAVASALGESERALQLLKSAIGDGWSDIARLAHDPAFEPLRERAGFEALLTSATR